LQGISNAESSRVATASNTPGIRSAQRGHGQWHWLQLRVEVISARQNEHNQWNQSHNPSHHPPIRHSYSRMLPYARRSLTRPSGAGVGSPVMSHSLRGQPESSSPPACLPACGVARPLGLVGLSGTVYLAGGRYRWRWHGMALHRAATNSPYGLLAQQTPPHCSHRPSPPRTATDAASSLSNRNNTPADTQTTTPACSPRLSNPVMPPAPSRPAPSTAFRQAKRAIVSGHGQMQHCLILSCAPCDQESQLCSSMSHVSIVAYP
jgi:hypothetical protein